MYQDKLAHLNLTIYRMYQDKLAHLNLTLLSPRQVAKGYSNATVHPSFRNILVNTLESTSFNGF